MVGLLGCGGSALAASSPLRSLLLFQILKILSGKIVVGHAVHNDFKALQYFHPKALTRDTSHIPPLNRKAECPENATVSLKCLTKKLLNRDIQVASPQCGRPPAWTLAAPSLRPRSRLWPQNCSGCREMRAGCSDRKLWTKGPGSLSICTWGDSSCPRVSQRVPGTGKSLQVGAKP